MSLCYIVRVKPESSSMGTIIQKRGSAKSIELLWIRNRLLTRQVIIIFRGEPYRERERERERDCVVVPSSQASSLQELGPSVKKIRLGEPKPELQQQLRIETRQVNIRHILLS